MIWQRELHAGPDGRLLKVALPEGYNHDGAPYPTLVCLDAQWTFGTVCDSSLNLGLARLLPRVIVVGVGWEHTRAREVVGRRAACYTPTEATVPPFVAPPFGPGPHSGGAPEYLAWLLGDALPLIDRTYHTDPAQRTVIGHSLSGLFGLYTLFHHPEAFSRWLLASPSTWWDDRVIFDIEQRQRAVPMPSGGRIFLSVGSEESRIGEIPMIANTEAMAAALSARAAAADADCEVHLQMLDGELHHSTIPAAVSRGLRWLYR